MLADMPREIANAVTNSSLKLIINSSEQCNLRCVYCYESFAVGHMDLSVASGIIQLVERRAKNGLKWLEVEFFGGEPLAAWHVVKYLGENLRRICSEYNVQFAGGMTTNATLLNSERLEWLVRHGFASFQITLDGPREMHDARRLSRNGRGTFDMIWGRLAMMRASALNNLDVTIRVHFDAASWSTISKDGGFVDSIIQSFARDDGRFRLQFNPLEMWGGGNGDGVQFFDSRAEMRAALRSLLDYASKAGLSSAQVPQLADRGETGESGCSVCYAARANSFVIRADGRVSKCTVALDDNRNIVGRISQNGELIIDHESHVPWLRGLASGNATELACPALGYVWQT